MKYYCDNKRHLVCVPFSISNLHLMAEDLGIKRCWFHRGDKPHYDIPKKRIVDIMKSVNVVSDRVILDIIKNNRQSI